MFNENMHLLYLKINQINQKKLQVEIAGKI